MPTKPELREALEADRMRSENKIRPNCRPCFRTTGKPFVGAAHPNELASSSPSNLAVEEEARRLLAAEYERAGQPFAALCVADGTFMDGTPTDMAFRAVIAALHLRLGAADHRYLITEWLRADPRFTESDEDVFARKTADAIEAGEYLATPPTHYHCANSCEKSVAELRCARCGGPWVKCDDEICDLTQGQVAR